MQNNNKLIGTINPEGRLSVKFSSGQFSDLDFLVQCYGWVGQGFGQILGNRHISKVLEESDVEEIVLDSHGIHGLENVAEGERQMLEEMLSSQYERSEGLVAAVRRDDFAHWDAVNSAVLKGLVLGIGVAGAFDLAGLKNTFTELVARGAPGLLESSAVSHHVLEKEEKVKSGNFMRRTKAYAAEIGLDLALIAKRFPAGLYEALNLGNWLDKGREKLLPRKVNKSFERALGIKENVLPTNTHLWSEEQESAPYRGLMGISLLSYFYGQSSSIFYRLLDSTAVFWVNSGNNIQGSLAVYSNIYKNLPKKMSSVKQKIGAAFEELRSDPFQLANISVVPTWFLGILAMHSYGFNFEEHFHNLGAALEASLIGVDTAIAAKLAKGMIYYNFSVAPHLKVSNPRLLQLARSYGAEEMMESLKQDRSPRGFITYHGGNLTFNTYDLVGTIAEKASHGAAAVGKFLHKLVI